MSDTDNRTRLTAKTVPALYLKIRAHEGRTGVGPVRVAERRDYNARWEFHACHNKNLWVATARASA